MTAVGVVVAALVQRGGRPRPCRWRLAELLMIVGTAPWLYLLLRPGHQRMMWTHGHLAPATDRYHVVPFVDLANQWHVGPGFFVYQVTGNLLVFAAFGFGAPVRWRLRPPAVLGIAALASACVEVTQYLMHDYRLASIDDVLVNAVGAGLAALCSRPWWRSRPGGQARAATGRGRVRRHVPTGERGLNG
jgi:VanZ like family